MNDQDIEVTARVVLTPAALAGVAAVMADAGAGLAGPLRSSLIAGGRSNLTFRLDDGVSAWVLRTPPRAGRTPSAPDVAREYRVTRALGRAGVPVATPVVLHEDETLLGGPFVVASYVAGTSVQTREDLDRLDDATVTACVDRLVETLVVLHGVDHVAAGLERFGRPDGYAERQLRRWSSQWEIVGDPALGGLARDVAARLSAAVPPQPAVGIVHGDYRIDNTILALDAPVAVAAVVDWELSTVGDPVADLALMGAYRHPAFDLVLGVPGAWTSDRLPAPDGLTARYEAAGGAEPAAWDFHLALGYYKIAVIAAGIDHRWRAGVGEGPGFATSGEAVAPLLETALSVAP